MKRARAIARALAVAAALASSAASAAPDTALRVGDVPRRIDALDPELRAKAFEQARAEVDLRRAEWNRVTGSIGLSASEWYAVYDVAPVGPDAASASTSVHSTGGALVAAVRVPLYAGGAISSGIDAAEARLAAARYDRARVRQELTAAALTAYARLVVASDQMAIATRAAERASRLVALATTRVGSGIAAQADVAQARLNELRQLEDVELRRGDRDLAAAVLRAALLLPAGAIAPVDSLETLAALEPGGPRERADLNVARATVAGAAADREVAASTYRPRLELFASGQYGNALAPGGTYGDGSTSTATLPGSTASPLLPAGDSGWTFRGIVSAGAQVTWNFWDLGVTRDKVARADAELSRARADLESRERTATREVEEARAREAQAERRVEVLRGGEHVAAEAVDLARARYESGTAILTEVLNAELEATGVESRQAQARFDRAVAHVERLRAEGRTP